MRKSTFVATSSAEVQAYDVVLGRLQRSVRALWWKVDIALLSLAMLLVVLGPPVADHGISTARIFELRISLLNALIAGVCLYCWKICIFVTRLRANDSTPISFRMVLFQILLRVTSCTGVAGLVLCLRHPHRFSPWSIPVFWCLCFLLFAVTRVFVIAFDLYIQPRFRTERRVVIAGSGWRAQKLLQEFEAHPKWRYRVLGFVDSDPQSDFHNFLGPIEDLESVLMRTAVDEVVIALPVKSKYDDIQTAIAACERVGVQSGYSSDLFNTEVAKRKSVEEHDPSSVVLHMVHNDQHEILKRIVDVLGATIGLLLLSPLMLIVAIAIKLTSKGPVIFRQHRYGLNKHIFTMYKFRSMSVNAEAQQNKLEHLNETTGPVFKIKHDPRVTKVGRLIRKASIDELPQLFNVLRGQMSLVGPRPLPTRDVSRFSEASLMRRFSVKPGLTGLWQVSGRSNTGFNEWIELDLQYIDHWSFLLDVKILAKTIPAVLRGEGAA